MKQSKIKLFIMVAVVCCSLFVLVSTAGATPEGSGRSDDPYRITTVEELKNIPTTGLGYHYKLMNDLDMEGVSFTPIGNLSNKFTGSFDGDGHIIKNLTTSNADYVGLFGCTNNAVIKNLGIEDCNITGKYVVGSIAGYGLNTTISKCFSKNLKINSTQGMVGGIIGCAEPNNLIDQCFTSGNLSLNDGQNFIGGIAGYANGSNINNKTVIQNCFSSCNIIGGSYCGGITGGNVMYCNITKCYATGKIQGKQNVASVSGYNEDRSTLNDCVGLSQTITAVTSPYNIARIGFKDKIVNNLAYDDMEVLQGSSPWFVKSTNPSINSIHGQNTTMAQLKQRATYEDLGWDFDDVWMMDSSISNFPVLRFAHEPSEPPAPTSIKINDTVTGAGKNKISYSTDWTYHEQTGAYEKDEAYTKIPGRSFEVMFDGKQIKWCGALNNTCGTAAVYIDGEFVKNVDCYNATRVDDEVLFDSGVLDSGEHTLKVMLLNEKNAASSDRYITVDSIDIN